MIPRWASSKSLPSERAGYGGIWCDFATYKVGWYGSIDDNHISDTISHDITSHDMMLPGALAGFRRPQNNLSDELLQSVDLQIFATKSVVFTIEGNRQFVDFHTHINIPSEDSDLLVTTASGTLLSVFSTKCC